MTKADIIKLAETLSHGWWLDDEHLEDFANLVAAAQKEADAKLIEEYPYWIGTNAQREIAAAIRGTT